MRNYINNDEKEALTLFFENTANVSFPLETNKRILAFCLCCNGIYQSEKIDEMTSLLFSDRFATTDTISGCKNFLLLCNIDIRDTALLEEIARLKLDALQKSGRTSPVSPLFYRKQLDTVENDFEKGIRLAMLSIGRGDYEAAYECIARQKDYYDERPAKILLALALEIKGDKDCLEAAYLLTRILCDHLGMEQPEWLALLLDKLESKLSFSAEVKEKVASRPLRDCYLFRERSSIGKIGL